MTIIQTLLQTSLPIVRATHVLNENKQAVLEQKYNRALGLGWDNVVYLQKCSLYDFSKKLLIAHPFSKSCLKWNVVEGYQKGGWFIMVNFITSVVLGTIISIWMKLDSDFGNCYKPQLKDTISIVDSQHRTQPSDQPPDYLSHNEISQCQPSHQPSNEPSGQPMS